jgi:predicted aspartyl protease
MHMRKALITLLLLPTLMAAKAQPSATSKLQELLRSHQLYELQSALKTTTIPQPARHLFTAALENAWMQAQTSATILNKIKPKELKALPDSLQVLYHSIQLDNHVKLFQYQQAADQGEILIQQFPSFFPPDQLQGIKEANIIWKSAGNEKKQHIQHNGPSALSIKRDIGGLMNVPVKSGDSTYNFVFDTGAGISTIMETYAAKLGLRIIENASVPIRSGITGIPTQARLGMASKLQIGNMEIHNALFLVFPDSALTFAKGLYKINGIIGFPIIKEMGETTLRNDSLFVNPNPLPFTGQRNLAVDLLKPYFFLSYQGKSLPFTFDTGAQESLFSDVFYKAYQHAIDETGKPVTRKLGGTNGTKAFNGFTMPALSFHWQGKEAVIKNAFVSKEELRATGKYYYGNIGKDFIGQFKGLTLNFSKAYIDFR